MLKKEIIYIAPIVSLWLISIIIINPLGNFPLNDDWAFGQTVKHLIEKGDYRPPGWTGNSLLTNALWGALFCIPTGFSFNALRISTLILSLLGVIGLYLLARELGKQQWLSAIAALTLCFSPIYYALSNTFMTDVPYTAITIFASICFVRNLKNDSNLAFLVGTIFAIAATLSRQSALSVPVAFAIASTLKNGVSFRNILRAATPFVCCVSVLLVFQQWLATTGRTPALYGTKFDNLYHALTNLKAIPIAKQVYIALLYLGWFLLPILLFVLGSIYKEKNTNKTASLIFSSSAMLIAGVFISMQVCEKIKILMPFFDTGNIIIESGIGPLILHDTYFLDLNKITALSAVFWTTVTVISLLGAALLITAIGLNILNWRQKLKRAKINDKEAAGVFLFLNAIIYLIPIFIIGYFDRYLMPAIPFLAAGIVNISPHTPQAATRTCRFASIVLLCAFSFFSICGTRDYLTWNKIRWDALNNLMATGDITPADIDGGFEFNGWHLYNPQYTKKPQKSWWWVERDTYRIGFGPMPNYTTTKEYSYRHWMPPHVGKIVVLKEKYHKNLD